jgi:hypothetical protein
MGEHSLILPEKEIILLVKKLTAFYGTRRYITVFKNPGTGFYSDTNACSPPQIPRPFFAA